MVDKKHTKESVARRHFKKNITTPEWFELSKYELENPLTPKEYGFQLSLRGFVLKQNEISENDYFYSEIKANGIKACTSKQSQASKKISYQDEILQLKRNIRNSNIKKGFNTKTVNALSMNELFNLYNCYKNHEETINQSNEIIKNYYNRKIELNPKHTDIIKESENLLDFGVSVKTAILEIDLNAPKKIILKDFETLLNAVKKDDDMLLQVNTLSNKNWFSNLHKMLTIHKVLPYLDLFIHYKNNGKKVTYSEYDEILFDDTEYDKTRRKTHPLAMKMIRIKEIMALNVST